MTIYNNAKLVANDLLKKFQQGSVSLVQLTAGTGPADKPGEPSETSYILNATVSGVSYKYIKSGFAVQTDLMVTSNVLSNISPSLNDLVEIDGTRYKILEFKAVPPAGTTVVWKFVIRKAS